MSTDPTSPNLPIDPTQNPDLPEPEPPIPGPDLPPTYPPASPGAPLVDPTPIAPVVMHEGSAYPEPPPSYEHFPAIPPPRSEGVHPEPSTTPEPTYQPQSVAGGVSPLGTEPHPAREAYPSAPPPYERRATDRNPDAPAPSDPPNFGRRHTDRATPTSPSSGSGRRRGGSRAPTAVVGAVILAVLALVAAGAWYFLHAGGHVITAGGELAATAAGLHYENGKEHIAFTAPGTWSRFPASTAQVMVRGEGCSFGLLEQRTLLSAQQLANAEAQDLHRRHPEAAPVITPRTIAGRDALTFSGTYTDSEGQAMTQTYILVDRGTNLLTLIETGTSAACPTSFSALEDSLRI